MAKAKVRAKAAKAPKVVKKTVRAVKSAKRAAVEAPQQRGRVVKYKDIPAKAKKILDRILELEDAKYQIQQLLLELVRALDGATSLEMEDGTEWTIMERKSGTVFWRPKPGGRPPHGRGEKDPVVEEEGED